jgi:hypothetical protein
MRRFIGEVTSDRQGQFEIRGTAEQLELEARATKDRYYDSDLQPFTRGATDVQLVVREGGVVAGRVLLDPWVPSEKIRVIVQPIAVREAVPTIPSWVRELAPAALRLVPDGRFTQFGIPAPTVVLSVRVENDAWDAVRLENVQVRAALLDAQDPRLDRSICAASSSSSTSRSSTRTARGSTVRVHLRNPADASNDCSRSTSGGHAQF